MNSDLKNLTSECTASMVIGPMTDRDRGYNQGLLKAVDFIDSYMKGKGMLQELDAAVTKQNKG